MASTPVSSRSLRVRDASEHKSELNQAVSAYHSAFLGIGLISAVVNVLYLTGSFFMLEVYDRVLPSKNVPTLVVLAIIVTSLFAFQAALDIVRARLLSRVGIGLDERLSARVYGAVLELPLRGTSSADGLQPIRDLDQVRAFLSGTGPMALFDLPWMPIYVGICFAFHVWIGIAALVGAVILVTLMIITEVLTRRPAQETAVLGAHRNGLAESSRRNAEVIRAMGMGTSISQSWGELNASYMAKQRKAADVAGALGAISKVARMFLQSAVLAVGAYLVIQQQSTAGIIIASSILTSRALAPVDLVISNWRGFIAARQSWARLRELLRRIQSAPVPVALPAPVGDLRIENITIVPPGGRNPTVQDVTFRLVAGQALGIIGPSASGKSTLARAIVGIWPVVRGAVRLDGGALDQWSPDSLGIHIGYLPQDIQLFEGTIAQNISRFDATASSELVVEAAIAAGVHDLILRLPNGYNTQIAESGTALSAGQRQRVALARTLYRSPFVVVLDEPNSNLDQDGENALNKAIRGIRERGGIAIIIAHRPSVVAQVDQLMVLAEGGRVVAVGPKDDVVAKVFRTNPSNAGPPLAVVPQKSV